MKKLTILLLLLTVVVATNCTPRSRSGQLKAKAEAIKATPKPLQSSDVIALIDAGKGRNASSTAVVDVVVLKLSTYPDSVIYKYSYDYSSQYVFVDFK